MKTKHFSYLKALNEFRSILIALFAILISVTVYPQARTGWIPTSTQAVQDRAQKVYMKDETTSGMLINFDVPGIYVYELPRKDTIYQRVLIPGHGTTTSLGKPELPVVGRMIEIPYDVTLDISIFKSEFTTIKDYNVFPYQIPEIDPQQDDSLFIKDYKQYSEDAFFPQNLTEVSDGDIGIIRGHRVAFLKVNPIQYNPVKKELKIYSKIEVQIKYDKPAQVERIKPSLVSPAFENLLSNTVLNFKDINRYNQYKYGRPWQPGSYGLLVKGDNYGSVDDSPDTFGSSQDDDADDEASVGCEYLIITTSTFFNSTDPNNSVLRFRNWKRQQGLLTEVVLFSDLPDADNSGGLDTADIIDYIQTAYDTWYPAPTYILIIGDAGDNAGNVIIPTNYRHQDPSHSNTLRGTDLYYTTVDGTDYFPDIYGGRLAVDTDIEATNIINKIIAYEQNPPGAGFPNFYQNIPMIALFEDTDNNGTEDRPWIETVETIRTFLVNQGYGVDRIYNTSGAVAPARYQNGNNLPNDLSAAAAFQWTGGPANISNAINNGRCVVLFRDHGARQEWTEPNFFITDVDNLGNGVQQPVIFSVACQTGWFDNETDQNNPVTSNTDESFCEHFIRNNSDGTAAIIGASRNSVTGYNDFMSLGFIKALWNNFNPDPPYANTYPDIPDISGNQLWETGQVMNFGKIYMANAYTNSTFREEAFELYHVFGDPNMNILVEQPGNISITYPENIGGNYDQDFIVTVTDQTAEPLNNAVVSLCDVTGNLVGAQMTNAGGEARFSSSFIGNTLTLTITADEFIPRVETINVSQNGGILNRLDPDNGTQGQAVNVGGKYFNGTENVEIYFDNQLVRTVTASGGSFGQSGVEDISVTIPNNISKGRHNVILKGANSGKYAVDVFHVRDPNPVDLFLYSQWDPSTYYLHNGDNPTWNNPDIYLTDINNNPVGSNNLVVGNQYNIYATIRNNSSFVANNATITFKLANFGSAQRTWTNISTNTVNVPANGNASAQVQWVPPITGHLCILAEIYHNEDTNGANNAGQENCHVGPTSSPLSVTFSVRNPSDVARALHYEVRQLTPAGERKKSILWNTTIKHPDPQVLQPGGEAEVIVTVDPDYTYVKPGEKAEFAVTNYLDREIIGGVNLTAARRGEKYQVSIHGGMVNPLAITAEYFTSGFCFMADFGYSISPNLTLICLLGINAFGENTGSSDTKDKTMLNLNVDAQYQTWVSGKLSTYVRAGAGYHKTLGNWSKSGISSGAGLEYHFSNKLGLNIGADYDHILKGLDFDLIPAGDFEKDVQFLQITLGLNFHF